MMRRIHLPAASIVAGAALAAATAAGGTISGVVKAEGKRIDAPESSGSAYESRQYKFLERLDYSELRDFVVHIEGPVAGDPGPPTNRGEVVAHKNATFLPYVLPIAAGTAVAWPNRDDIFHNAFSFSEAKPFDLGYYKDEVRTVVFDKPGRVDVFCSIHKNMHCIVLVLENSFFAKTDERGRYAIRDVPPGTYRLRAWHERMPPQVREVTVPADGDVRVDFTLGITGLPTY